MFRATHTVTWGSAAGMIVLLQHLVGFFCVCVLHCVHFTDSRSYFSSLFAIFPPPLCMGSFLLPSLLLPFLSPFFYVVFVETESFYLVHVDLKLTIPFSASLSAGPCLVCWLVFCQLYTNLDISGKREFQLRNCFHQITL